MAGNKDYESLLSRLNALKAPKVSASPSRTSRLHPAITPVSESDDIAARFRRLASGSSPRRPQTYPSQILEPTKTESLPSETIPNEEDDRSFNDLLTELGADQSSWLVVKDEDTIAKLLGEAQNVLSEDHASKLETQHEYNEESSGPLNVELEAKSEEQERQNDEQDEKEAEDYIAQVLADIEHRKEQELSLEDEDDESEGHHRQSEELEGSKTTQVRSRSARESTPLDALPSAPATAPVSRDLPDDELEARFASLSLPSTPTNKPNAKKPPPAASRTKPSALEYTDEDIDSWCVICNEDAAVRCLGCEGDLYCQECWNEGHRGRDVSLEERKHKAVIYNRGERGRKVAAA